MTQLPVVDIAGLFSATLADRNAVAIELGRAARDFGFLYVTGHGIAQARMDALIACARAYFAQPLPIKMADYIGRSTNHSGYVPEGEEVFANGTYDRKEAFDVNNDLPDGVLPDMRRGPIVGANLWPEFPGFQRAVQEYYREALDLGRVLFRGFALALDLDEAFFEKLLIHPPSQLRMVHYPVDPTAPPDAPGIGAHTDYECFTILLPTAPGLEVMDSTGTWVDAPPVPGALVVNIGDLLEIWTNGAFVATSHRVRKVTTERYSFPLFCCCDYDTLVAPLPQFLTAGEPSRYAPRRAGDHLLAQTMQTFTYLKRRLSAGEIVLPDDSAALSSFGQEAKQPG